MATWRAWDAPISTDRTEREQEDGNVPSPGGMVSFSLKKASTDQMLQTAKEIAKTSMGPTVQALFF